MQGKKLHRNGCAGSLGKCHGSLCQFAASGSVRSIDSTSLHPHTLPASSSVCLLFRISEEISPKGRAVVKEKAMYTLSKTILVGTVVGSLFAVAGMAQAPTSPATASCPGEESGIVVETLAEHAEGEKAGLRDGDIIVGWSRGETKAAIRSAFDLIAVEIEQAPRGPVTLQGLRAQAKQSWTIGPSTWGITAGQNLPENLLTIYREAEELAKAKKFAEAEPLWRKASESSQCPDVSAWLLFRAAGFPADARQWQGADPLYRDALDRAPKDSPN